MIKEKLIAQFKQLASKDFGELVQLGAQTMQHVSTFAEKPSPINGLKLALDVWSTLNSIKSYSGEFFLRGWLLPFDRQCAQFIVDSIEKFPYRIVRCADTDAFVKIATVYGEEVGWVCSTTNNVVADGIYVKMERLNEAQKAIMKALWNRISHRAIVMEKMPSNNDAYTSFINFKKDSDLSGLSSSKADQLTSVLKKFSEKAISRSVLLYGRPGTGKSTIAQRVCEQLGFKTLRIRVEDIAEFNNNVIFEALRLFEPDAIILDDLDRSVSQSHLLETLTRFHKHVKLVFATVNDRSSLDEALMRPGRFDMIENIKRLDDTVILKLLGETDVDLLKTVRDWPIAFIEEYAIRRKVMTKEEAMGSLKELQARVDRLVMNSDDEDEPKTELTQPQQESPEKETLEVVENLMTSEEHMDVQDEALVVPQRVRKYLKNIKMK